MAGPRRQFEHLIRIPCQSACAGGPLVLIIDALDECGQREDFVKLMASEFSKLPRRFRVIVTGRPESDISRLTQSMSKYPVPHAGSGVSNDIKTYAAYRLQEISSAKNFGDEWPTSQDIQTLVDRSSGLFIWIKTACDVIGKNMNPKKELQSVLSPVHNLGQGIDALYLFALQRAYDWESETLAWFYVFVGVVMIAKTPLSMQAIDMLVKQYGTDVPDPQSLLGYLKSLLDGVDVTNTPVKTLHPSFHDFLTDKSRSANFYIDKVHHNAQLALSCVQLMNAQLKRNICGVANERALNVDIPEDVIQQIPEALKYAVCFGVDHIVSILPEHVDNALIKSVEEFLNNHLLEWMEVLSLLKCIDVAHSLKHLGAWLKVSACDWRVGLKTNFHYLN
jgi:hypothetical protein